MEQTIKLVIVNIILLLSVLSYSQQARQSKSYFFDYQGKPLYMVLEDIRNRIGVNFIYHNDLVKNISISCKSDSAQILISLKKNLEPYDIGFREFKNNSIVIFKEKKRIQKTEACEPVNQIEQQSDTSLITVDPKRITNTNAYYPPEAVEKNIEGKVVVKLLVNKEGKVNEALIDKSSGSSILDSAAIDYSKTMMFTPAIEKGKAKIFWILITFEYNIIAKKIDE